VTLQQKVLQNSKLHHTSTLFTTLLQNLSGHSLSHLNIFELFTIGLKLKKFQQYFTSSAKMNSYCPILCLLSCTNVVILWKLIKEFSYSSSIHKIWYEFSQRYWTLGFWRYTTDYLLVIIIVIIIRLTVSCSLLKAKQLIIQSLLFSYPDRLIKRTKLKRHWVLGTKASQKSCDALLPFPRADDLGADRRSEGLGTRMQKRAKKNLQFRCFGRA